MRMLKPSLVLALGSLVATPGGFARSQEFPPAAPLPASGTGIVFVADGAGNFRVPSRPLGAVAREAGGGMSVERVGWARGGFRPLRDLLDHQRHLDQGAALAAKVEAYQSANPGGRVVLVGHSTGAAVVLAAAEALPPGSVDRIVLLAAAVSARYDLQRAQASTREGIDSFYSRRDGVLSTFVMALGNADRRWGPSGGWLGFRSGSEDGMLRQHRWGVAQIRDGNFGGHFGATSAGFLRAEVLPVIAPASEGAPVSLGGEGVAGSAAVARPGLIGRIGSAIRR